jgi:hypothetical protein
MIPTGAAYSLFRDPAQLSLQSGRLTSATNPGAKTY